MSEISANLLYSLLRSVFFTPHFSAYELIYSNMAARHGLLNLPHDGKVFENLKRVANFLELLRSNLSEPIRVNSGYRSKEVNKLVGGVSDSKHLQGLAVDIAVDRLPLSYYLAAIDIVQKQVNYKIKVIPGNGSSYIHIQFDFDHEQRDC